MFTTATCSLELGNPHKIALVTKAGRNGRIVGYRDNFPCPGVVIGLTLEVQGRTLSTGHGFDLHGAHDIQDVFKIEKGQDIKVTGEYTGLVPPRYCSGLLFTHILEWVYAKD
jgi:hypothetical protein